MKSFWIQVTLNIINGILVRKGSWIFEIQRHRKEHTTTVSEWVLWLWITMPWVAGSCQKTGEWHRTAFSFWAAEGANPAGTLSLWMQDKYVLHCWVDMLALGFLRQVFRLAWNSIRYWLASLPSSSQILELKASACLLVIPWLWTSGLQNHERVNLLF